MTAIQIETLLRAALLEGEPGPLLQRAAELADCTRERQLVALAAARVAGDLDRVEALAREYLIDHPGSALAAEIATSIRTSHQEH